MNHSSLVGRVGHVGELRTSGDGRRFLRLRVATDDSYVDRRGERQERTNWHTVKVFDRAAEWLAKRLTKGSLVSVEGRAVNWEADGPNGKSQLYEVEAFRVEPLDSKAAQATEDATDD